MMKLLFLAAGGAAGAVLRYAVSGMVYRFTGDGFPWGTLCVNAAGAFFIGILSGVFERFVVWPGMRVLVLAGVLGAFTTFSTYSLESLNLFRAGEHKLALLNIFLSNAGCLAAVYLGFVLSRWWMGLVK